MPLHIAVDFRKLTLCGLNQWSLLSSDYLLGFGQQEAPEITEGRKVRLEYLPSQPCACSIATDCLCHLTKVTVPIILCLHVGVSFSVSLHGNHSF